MDTLKVPLASVPDHGLNIDATVPGEEVQPPAEELPNRDVEPLRLEPVTVKGSFNQVDNEYVFHGTVSGGCIRACDRCLEDAEDRFRIEVLWTFARGAVPAMEYDLADGDMDAEEAAATNVTLFQGDEIDLAPSAWEEIVLELPSKFVCREECRGLCPRCGANLNTKPCQCAQEEAEGEKEFENQKNQGLAKLREMFPDLKADQSED